MNTFIFVTLWSLRHITAAQNRGSVRTLSVENAVAADGEIASTVSDVDNQRMHEKDEVTVELHEHFHNPDDAAHVTALDLKVTLGVGKYFLCSYMVKKSLDPVIAKVCDGGPTTCKENLDVENMAGGHGTFVASELPEDPEKCENCATWQQEDYEQIMMQVRNGTRLSCEGRIKVKGGSPFETLTNDNERDIMQLNMWVTDASHRQQVNIIRNTTSEKFFVIGHNQSIFKQQGLLADSALAQKKRNLRRQSKNLASTRNLQDSISNLYKFKCRETEKTFTIQIGIIADKEFCRTEADGNTADCENAASAIVRQASLIMEAQLNVSIHMATFIYERSWKCDEEYREDKFFLKSYERMKTYVPGLEKRALYHYFTTCVPSCFPGCGVTLGLATIQGLKFPMTLAKDGTALNVGINRFAPSAPNTFVHELGHSLGFGHFFSYREGVSPEKQDRDAGLDNITTDENGLIIPDLAQYGVMDYTSDSKLRDESENNRYGKYNGVEQFTPRHEAGLYGNKTEDDACRTLNDAYEAWENGERLDDEIFSAEYPSYAVPAAAKTLLYQAATVENKKLAVVEKYATSIVPCSASELTQKINALHRSEFVFDPVCAAGDKLTETCAVICDAASHTTKANGRVTCDHATGLATITAPSCSPKACAGYNGNKGGCIAASHKNGDRMCAFDDETRKCEPGTCSCNPNHPSGNDCSNVGYCYLSLPTTCDMATSPFYESPKNKGHFYSFDMCQDCTCKKDFKKDPNGRASCRKHSSLGTYCYVDADSGCPDKKKFQSGNSYSIAAALLVCQDDA